MLVNGTDIMLLSELVDGTAEQLLRRFEIDV